MTKLQETYCTFCGQPEYAVLTGRYSRSDGQPLTTWSCANRECLRAGLPNLQRYCLAKGHSWETCKASWFDSYRRCARCGAQPAGYSL